ncbi:MFS transporter [Staphylococcus aureus]|uniref:MFS transporter n=1 Tax=Staphylococcus aureus TaxID=1280 RepID=UPI0001B70158|nr:MFS transporter [Staphylococcus aureus]AZG95836.1 MFS transporter [Staphylococcus aureus]AZL91512.1 MFS transporter [Staphylococcus aureus]EEV03475.1 major facilitator superfamily transporter MFS_1 [Staphylococcus aureus subsp. aureus 55/2053]EEV08999.1 major facilitator transporter [Staphylococcus aureus subsp. aureus 68-397]EEV11852.1 major facilitator transporter [Staphylococcus aureus subsp. aureus E1410]
MSYASVLFNKNFTFYLIGIAFSNIGSAFTTFVFPLMILKLTGSAFQVGIVSALSFIPYAILGLPAGALIDRLNKKTIMKCADIIRLISYLSIPVLSFYNMLSIFQIYVVAIISGIGLVFHSISEVSIIPSIVKEEDLASANSYIYATQNVSEFLGPIIGGLLYTYMGYSILIFIDSMTFLLSFFSLILIKIETKSIFNQEKLSGKNFLSDVKVGFDYLLSNSTIRVMAVVVSLSNLIISPYYIYIVMFVKEDMNQSSQALGLVLGISSLGALIGSLSASFLLKLFNFGKLIVIILFLDTIFRLMLPFSTYIFILIPLLGLTYMTQSILNIAIITLRQKKCSEHMLGRVNSVYKTMVFAFRAIGLFLGGILLENKGGFYALTISAVLFIPLVLYILKNRFYKVEE